MRINWNELETAERAEREAILAADGIDPKLAYDMTRKNIDERRKAVEKREFMERMKRDHLASKQREANVS